MPFLSLLLGNWRWIALALAVAVPTAGMWIQTKRLHGCQDRYNALQATHEAFVSQVQAAGEKAAREAQERAQADKAAKEKADADHAKAVAALHNDITRMRRERDKASAGARIVPPAPSGSSDPAGACFDRAELEREIRGSMDELRAEVRKLVDEGSAAQLGLDAARRWAQGQSR